MTHPIGRPDRRTGTSNSRHLDRYLTTPTRGYEPPQPPGTRPTLRAATARAWQHAGAGNEQAAVELLRPWLGQLVPDRAGPDDELIDAATLYAEIAEPPLEICGSRLGWARYAIDASTLLHDAHHERRLNATDALAWALHRTGHDHEAVQHGRAYVAAVVAVHRSYSSSAFYARMDLADYLHAAGDCTAGLRETTNAWHAWSHTDGPPRRGEAQRARLRQSAARCQCQLVATWWSRTSLTDHPDTGEGRSS